MEEVEKMTAYEFKEYLSKCLNTFHTQENVKDFLPILKRSKEILDDNPQICINKPNLKELQKGNRFSIVYDDFHYYLKSNYHDLYFSPRLTRDEIEKDFQLYEKGEE